MGKYDPIRQAADDHISEAERSSQETESEEIIGLIGLVAQDVEEWKRGEKSLKPSLPKKPSLGKMTRQAILVAVFSLILVFAGGTSVAFAKPEHALATPFRGAAITMTEASFTLVSLIEDVRGVAAAYERNTVSTMLQSMRVIEGLREVSPLTEPTNVVLPKYH